MQKGKLNVNWNFSIENPSPYAKLPNVPKHNIRVNLNTQLKLIIIIQTIFQI